MKNKVRELCMDEVLRLCQKCVPEDKGFRPKVAAVLANSNGIIQTAFRGEIQPGEHAEFTLLHRKMNGNIPDDSTLFVSLEPCSARGPGKKSCADRIIDSGIKEVVIGTLDPNPQIKGRGMDKLWDAGIDIDFFDPSRAAQLEALNTEFVKAFKEVRVSEIKSFSPDGKYLILFCGASSTGKDTLLSRIRGRLIELGIRTKFIKKFTTRPERPGEKIVMHEQWMDPSSQYEFLLVDEFASNTDITAKYEKYTHHYGFSRAELMSDSRDDRILFGIYGDMENLRESVAEIENTCQRTCLVYLLRTDIDELDARLKRRRGFNPESGDIRKEEMRTDHIRVERLIRDRGSFKYFTNANIDNPDSVAEVILRDILYSADMLTDQN